MTLGFLFWLLMVIWVVFSNIPAASGGRFAPLHGNILLILLFGLLGWATFGPILR